MQVSITSFSLYGALGSSIKPHPNRYGTYSTCKVYEGVLVKFIKECGNIEPKLIKKRKKNLLTFEV